MIVLPKPKAFNLLIDTKPHVLFCVHQKSLRFRAPELEKVGFVVRPEVSCYDPAEIR